MAETKAATGKEPEGKKTVRVTQVASAAGRFADQRQTLIGLGLNKIRRTRDVIMDMVEEHARARGYARRAGHDQQGPPPRAGRVGKSSAMRLNQLSDNPGSRKARMRVGRGIGSGKGKTAGRGGKGQTARTGVAINGFEGGQMPLHMRMPKRGFNNVHRLDFVEVNVGRLQEAIEAGRLSAGDSVDGAAMVTAGVIRRERDGVRLLAKGELKAKLVIKVAGASKAAIAAVEKAGGSVEVKISKKAAAKAAAAAEAAEKA